MPEFKPTFVFNTEMYQLISMNYWVLEIHHYHKTHCWRTISCDFPSNDKLALCFLRLWLELDEMVRRSFVVLASLPLKWLWSFWWFSDIKSPMGINRHHLGVLRGQYLRTGRCGEFWFLSRPAFVSWSERIQMMNSYGLLFETFLWCVRGTHHWAKSAGSVSKCHGGSTSQTVDHCASSTYLRNVLT